MGGLGSGRSGGGATVDDCLRLDLSKLFRNGAFEAGRFRTGTLCWQGGFPRGVIFSLDYRASLESESGSIFIEHGNRKYWVELTTTSQRFGGRRWWFVCPLTGSRVLKLHLPPGASTFASRQAHGLSYRSQRGTPLQRAMDQFHKLAAALEDEDGCIDEGFLKPKWMRWSTFERKVRRIEALEHVVDAGHAAAAAKLMDR